MAKKPKPLISPRRPPPAASPKALEEFIGGKDPDDAPSVAAHAAAPVVSEKVAPPEMTTDVPERSGSSVDVSGGDRTPPRPRGLVAREGGRLRRRRTIYLPPELDEQLDRWCAEQGREVSHAVAEAIRRMLAGQH